MNNEFKEIEDLLAKADVGSDRYKKTIFNKLKYRMETGTLRTNNNLENNYVNKKKIFKPAKVVALALATVFIATGAAYGNQMISKIIQSFSVGNTEIVQYDMDESRNHSSNEISLKAMQEGFQGKLFDKDGNEVLYGEHQEYYDVNGNFITSFGVKDLENGGHEFAISTELTELNEEKIFDLENVKKVANSNIKFFDYLPEGFEFKDGSSKSNGNNIRLKYGNKSGETIDVFSSVNGEINQAIATTEEVREEHIDGKNVIITRNSAVWESEGVTYQLYLNSNKDENKSIDVNELSKMIKSMK